MVFGLTTTRRANQMVAEARASLENPQVPLSDVNAWHQLLGDWFNAAGEIVTPETALKVPAIWCATNFISSSFASLPLQVFTRDGEAKKADDGNPLYALLHDAPNPEWTSFNWRKYSMMNVLVYGGRSYTYIEKNKASRVTGLYPLDPTRVVVKRSGGVKTYEYRENETKVIVYKSSEIIDIPFQLEANGLSHVNPVIRLAGTVGLSLAIQRYAERFFLNGGVPPLQLIGELGSPAAMSRAATDVEKAIRAANEERRNVMNVPAGYKLDTVGYNPKDSQMEEARQFQIGEVARMYGLPPIFLQDLTHGTYSNTEQQDLAYVKHTLTTWLEAWEQELNLKLFPAGSKKFVEFNVDGLLRGDFTTRMNGYARGIQTGQLTPNEARASENRPPMDEGDKLYVQGATVPLGTVLAQPAKPSGDPASNDNQDMKDAAA